MTENQIKKHKTLTYIMYNIVAMYLADELAGEYITKDVKMTHNRYIETFMKRNEGRIRQMFDMKTSEDDDRGSAFLDTQTLIENLTAELVDLHLLKEIKDVPIYGYPDLTEIIKQYKAELFKKVVSEKINVDEGEE